MLADNADNAATAPAPRTVLCLASYEKGHEFLRECKRLGWRTLLLTVTDLRDAAWPRESLDDLLFVPDLAARDDVIKAVAYLARERPPDRIVALDDYDVETAAALREHLRLPGMGASRAKLVRDKLAMRVRAREAGILVPEFIGIFARDALSAFMARVPPPWVLKPRAEVSTIGIARIAAPDDLWPRLDELGDRQSFFLLERYIPGDVYHVDTIIREGEVLLAEAHRYARPPLDVFHTGGIASTRPLPRDSEDAQALDALNRLVLEALELRTGVSHVEFIRGSEDGRFYFLEAGARVGGAHIVELIEAATGLNLWREWAWLELGEDPSAYRLPARRFDYGGLIVTLARQEHPDTSAYADPEIVWRMEQHHHVGFVVASGEAARVAALLEDYSRRFEEDFFASMPPLTDPTQIRGAHHAPET